MLDPFSREVYDSAVSRHLNEIRPALQHLDAAIAQAAVGNSDPAEADRLLTMRVLLASGLFDPDFYLLKYPDVLDTELGPLEHYVRCGDAQRRLPNPAFLPGYYRREYMSGAPGGDNALRHYVEGGESSGGKPNAAFDPRVYVAANPMLSKFVDRPLFHYLEIGRTAPGKLRGMPSAVVIVALEGIEEARWNAENENTYYLTRTRRKITSELGISEGFTLYKQVIGLPDHAEIHQRRLTSLKEIAEKRDGAFRETAPAGEPFVVPPPLVIGEGGTGPLTAQSRAMFVACLIDARVRAGSEVIEVADLAMLDYQGEELARIDDQLDLDPAIFQTTDEVAWIITPALAASTVEIEEAFTLLGMRCDAFGHWMLEYLPKYVAASLSRALPCVPVLIEADLPKTHRQALALMLPDGVEIIELPRFATARVRRLWCASTLAYFPVAVVYNERFRWEYFVMPPARYAPIIGEMVRRADHASACSTAVERLFLAREPFNPHEMVNQAAIEETARERGFQVVYPQRLDFTEQVSLVRHARFVLGPSGGAMFLAFFARPGTRLCMFRYSDDVIAAQVDMTGLFDAIGLDVTVFTGGLARRDGDFAPNSDFAIDEESFCQFLDRWLPP